MDFKYKYAMADADEEGQENLDSMSEEELKEMAEKMAIPVNDSMTKQDIIRAIKNAKKK